MTTKNSLQISPDGFLYFKGAKLPFKIHADGFEFFEKDPRRAALLGGQRFVVPFEMIVEFIAQISSKELS
jgi:hypothetical protein